MTFPGALSAAQKNKLRGTGYNIRSWCGAPYVSLNANTTVFAARVNGAPSGNSYAQLTYDTVTTGAYTAINDGMRVLISATNDRRAAYFDGRVRGTPTSAILYINETSVSIADNDYIFVIADYPVTDRLAKDDGVTYTKDWDDTYAAPAPKIYGIKSTYADFVSGTPSGYSVAFAASAFAVASGATISSYAWTIPTGGTVTAGATNTANVTVRFDEGEYWVKLVVTDSGSRTATRWIKVWAHGRTTNTPEYGFDSISINATLDGGWSASIRGFTGIDDVLDGTLVCIWVGDEVYCETQSGALIDNVMLVGRLRRENNRGSSDETYTYLTDVQFEVEGIGAQLARLSAPDLAYRNIASPDEWDEMTNLTMWRSIAELLGRHSTVTEFCDLSFDSVTNTYKAQQLGTQDTNLLSSVNDLAESINAALEFAPGGAMRCVRDARYLTNLERNSLTTVIDYTTADIIDIVDWQRDHTDPTGRVDGSGGTFDSVFDAVTPLLSIAPGHAFSEGADRGTLARQILQADVAPGTAQVELNQRTGNYLALKNGGEQLTVLHPDGYRFICPSRYTWYTFTLDSTTNVRGMSYTSSTRWLCTAVSYTLNAEDGTCEVRATYTKETSGDPGQTVTYPPPTEETPVIGDIPTDPVYPEFPEDPGIIGDPGPVDPEPPPGSIPNNALLLIEGGTTLWYIPNPLSSAIRYDVTPAGMDSDETLVACLFAPQQGSTHGYILTNLTGGTQSRVWHSTNVTGPNGWTVGATLDGVYTVLRAGELAGGIFVYQPESSETTAGGQILVTFDTGGYSNYELYVVSTATPVITTGGNPGNCVYDGPSSSFMAASAKITLPVVAEVTNVNFDFKGNGGAGWNGSSLTIELRDADDTVLASNSYANLGATKNAWYNRSVDFSTPGVTYVVVVVGNDSTASAEGWLDNISVTYDITIANGKAIVAYSSEHGATWSVLSEVGDTPGAVGGYDVSRTGNYQIAGMDAKARLATSAGGAFSDAANGATTNGDPVLCISPYYDEGSTSTKNYPTADEYLIGSSALDGSSQSLWWADAGGRTDLTIGSTVCIGPNTATIWKGTKLWIVVNDAGTRKLYRRVYSGSWGAATLIGSMSANCDMIRIRRGDGTGNLVFVGDGPALKKLVTTTLTTLMTFTGNIIWFDIKG